MATSTSEAVTRASCGTTVPPEHLLASLYLTLALERIQASLLDRTETYMSATTTAALRRIFVARYNGQSGALIDIFISSGSIGVVNGFTFTPGAGVPTRVQPNHGGNAGLVTVTVIGSGFTAGVTVSLTGTGSTIVGTNTTLPYPSAASCAGLRESGDISCFPNSPALAGGVECRSNGIFTRSGAVPRGHRALPPGARRVMREVTRTS
jgi:hypothetical protein